MCSKTIPILRKTPYDFTFLPSPGSETIVIVPAIDVSSYYRAGLFIRIHNTQMASGQLVKFEIDNTLPSDEDPVEFIERYGTSTPPVDPLGTLELDLNDEAPGLISTDMTGLGAALRIRFKASQGSIGGTPFFIELSAVLVLRNF